jgi:hypothetical protein
MKENYTHISVILDRTGSMESIRDDVIGGFNAFLGEQKKLPGKATLTLVQFDSQDPYEIVHDFKPIGEVGELTREAYVPRASTPLLDAMGRAINDLEKRISEIQPEERPAKVILAVVTDGHENASMEFRREQVVKMIQERTEKDGWQFVFLSAGLDAIRDARAMGINADAVLVFKKDARGTRDAYTSLSKQTSEIRTGLKKIFSFDEEDRKSDDDPQKKKKPN